MAVAAVETTSCGICENPELATFIAQQRKAGHGYRRIALAAKVAGFTGGGQHSILAHWQHTPRDDSAVYGIGDAQDRADTIIPDDEIADYLKRQGIENPPEGMKFVAATLVARDDEGKILGWPRIAPDGPDEERIEIRQAEPVIVQGINPSPTVFTRGAWKTWLMTPDLQCGYWIDSKGVWHTIHDERAVDLTFQVGRAVADSEGLYGWLDLGDVGDLACFSVHKNGPGDMQVAALNKTTTRVSHIMAQRRFLVGPDGLLVCVGGNHEIRAANSAQANTPYLVGLKRADDPEDEHPVLTLPYLARFREHGVRWVSSYPMGYYRVNSNLVAMHCPAYGSKALQTAQKISSTIHSSVVHGHTHRREAFAHNIETDKGNRTFEIWSDGALCRIDGSVPSAKATYNDNQDRIIASNLPEDQGLISENWHVGLSVVHVDYSERGLFAREPITIWGDWCRYRGVDFQAAVDVDGNPLAA